jgi:Na+-driven multidrug efflux pump
MILAIVIMCIVYIALVIHTADSPKKVKKVPRKRWNKRKVNKELVRLMERGDF